MAERAARGEARRLALLAKPKKERVVLTDAERAERKREERRNWKHRRRALLAGQECKATPSQIRKHCEKAKGICFYCRRKFKSLTVDHIVPMAKGGTHTLDNIVFACHACNSEKRDLDPAEYAKSHGMLLV
jgi:5-methylcytosine-specific restriction endonuclease McrA